MKFQYLSAASIAAIALAGAAHAQESSTEPTSQMIDEIIVTATKRELTLQEVPFSIQALTERELRNRGSSNLEEIAANVAGFTVQNLGPGQSQVAIRGISAGQIVRDLPGVKEQVGIYLDESPISLSLFTPDLDFFDTERIEILRGPQGTLFGSGSLSGTVRYITNKPQLNEFSATIELTGRALTDGDLGGDIKGAVNIPVVEDKLALRVVGYATAFPGFIDRIDPTDFSTDDDANDGRRFGTRISALFQPTDGIKNTLRMLYQDADIDGFNRVDIYNVLANPFTTTRPAVELDDRNQVTSFDENFSDEYLLIDNTLEIEFGSVALTSVTTYTNRDIVQVRDSSQIVGAVLALQGFTDPAIITNDASATDVTDLETFSQEIRLASIDPVELGGATLDWLIGGFYSDISREYGQQIFSAGIEANTGFPTAAAASQGLAGLDILFASDIPFDLEQFAVFGEATLHIGERLHVTGGFRYFDFEEDRVLTFDGLFADTSLNGPGDVDSDGFNPRAIVAYDVSDHVQVNAQVAKGFRLGGINDPINIGVPECTPDVTSVFGGQPTFDDEEVWNYELGIKARSANGRFTFNAAGFYTDIQDLQAVFDVGACSSRVILNIPEARAIGAEAELSANVLEGLDFSISASYVDTEIEEGIVGPDGGFLPGTTPGNRLPTVPEFQFAAAITYERPIGDLMGFTTFSFQHVGSRFTQLADQEPGFGVIPLGVVGFGDPSVFAIEIDPKLSAYQLGNLRVGVRSDSWEVAVFVNNLWDETAELALDRELGLLARAGVLINPPRTYGLMLRATY